MGAAVQLSTSPMSVKKYHSKISGAALLDRVDIHLNGAAGGATKVCARAPVETSGTVRARVEAARDRQLERFKSVPGIFANAHMGPRDLARYVESDRGDREAVLKAAIVETGIIGPGLSSCARALARTTGGPRRYRRCRPRTGGRSHSISRAGPRQHLGRASPHRCRGDRSV